VTLHPILLSHPRVTSYGATILLAWCVGWWLARRRARGLGIPSWHIDWLAPLLLVSVGLGSRLAGRLGQLLSGGFSNDRVLWGGALLAACVATAYAVAARISLGRLADTFAYSLAAGIALLRIGCFLAGCCWGDLCVSPDRLATVDDRDWRRQVYTIPIVSGPDWPLGVKFPVGSPAYFQHLTAGLLPPAADRSLPVHPVQLYEMAGTLALLGVLVGVDRRLRHWGESFLVFGLGYAAVRFVVEWFRADNLPLACDLALSQWVSAGFGCACLIAWNWRLPRLLCRE
jgi:phosphatidylglycerol:prolipoprotein diacylglycerol transferase